MHELLGTFEGITVEGLENSIKAKEAKYYKDFSVKELHRILQQSIYRIKRDYSLKEDRYMVKDYKTKTKWMLWIDREVDTKIWLIS